MSQRPIRIASNFQNLNQAMFPDVPFQHEHMADLRGWRGVLRLTRASLRSDVVILNIEPTRLYWLCALGWVLPFLTAKVISVDLILRSPKSFRGRVVTFVKRILLKRVHRFILYFKNIQGYERYYGISPRKVVYVPFKVNRWETIRARADHSAPGSYVLCAGRTLRDVRTFVRAMEIAGCPGMLLQQNSQLLMEHGTESWSGELPPNVRLVIDPTNVSETFIDFLADARIVVVPRFKFEIAASGIGTYLAAMALNRCVIISEGPAASDVLTDQAVMVPPEDVDALAAKIALLWDNHELRSDIAASGLAYASRLEGEDRLHRDILRTSVLSVIRPKATEHVWVTPSSGRRGRQPAA